MEAAIKLAAHAVAKATATAHLHLVSVTVNPLPNTDMSAGRNGQSIATLSPYLQPEKLATFASQYAASGFKPVLLKPNEKAPAFPGWQTMPASAVGDILKSLETAFNLGIAIPDGYVVIDVDIKNGGKGFDTLRVWEDEYGGLGDGLTQRSASGGLHFLFKLPPGVRLKNAVGIAPGIDIRTVGGFIVAEPSEINGKPYSWRDWDVMEEPMPDIPMVPAWLIEKCPKHQTERTAHNDVPEREAMIGEGRRNDALFRKASVLRGQGLNEGEVLAALHGINNRLCQPPLQANEVANIAKSVMRYAPNPLSPRLPPKAIQRREFALMSRTAANLFVGKPKEAKFLVQGIIPAGKLVIVASPPGIGKSFSALELALNITNVFSSSILNGARFCFGGRVLDHGRAVYISAEDDEEELHRRAYTLLDGQPMPERLHVVSLPDQGHFSILQGDPRSGMKPTDDWQALREEICQLDDLRLIIVDTFQAVSAGDLNLAEVAQAVMNELVEVANQTGATIIALHHLVKWSTAVANGLLSAHQAMDTIRGSGAIAGSARAAYCLFPHPKGKEVCEVLEISYEENKVIYGLVAKANGAARRGHSIYVRDERGVLCDKTAEYYRRTKDDASQLDGELVQEVEKAWQNGQPFAASSTSINGMHKRRYEMGKQFHNLSAAWFAEHAEILVREEKLRKEKVKNGYQFVPIVSSEQAEPQANSTDLDQGAAKTKTSSKRKRTTAVGKKTRRKAK